MLQMKLNAAEKSRAEANKLLEEQRALLKEARTEAQALLKMRKNKAIFNVKKSL